MMAVQKKEELFFKRRLMCDRCKNNKATWIAKYGNYKVYCQECHDVTWGSEEDEDV